MSDEPFYSPKFNPPPPRMPSPGEPLWSVLKDHHNWRAELHFHGESWGWEAQILRDDELVIGRRFLLKDLAVKWANEERDAIVYDRHDSWL